MLAACSVAASACSGGGSSKGKAPARGAAKLRQRASVPARPGPLRASVAGVLPGPVQLPGAAILPGGPLLVMGGLDSSDVSTAQVAALQGARTSIVGQLPQP